MERLTFYPDDSGNPASRRGWKIALSKLATYENAEEQGFIKRCPKCGSLNVNQNEFADWVNLEYKCKVCTHEW